MSPSKRLARIAGFLYLLVAIFGGFAFGYVLGTVYLPGDAAVTAANVAANAGLARFGVIADLFQATVFVFLGMMLYQLLKHVNQQAAGAMLILVAITTAIMCLNDVFQFAAVLVATDKAYVAGFGPAGANALVLLLLDIHHYGFLIAQIFFGLWLLPLGYLAWHSGMFPRALGGVLIAGGVCYLVDMLGLFLFPGVGEQIHGLLAIPPTISELWMVGYLLVKGVREPAPGAKAANTSAANRAAARPTP